MLAWVEVTEALFLCKDKEKGGRAECQMKGWAKGLHRMWPSWLGAADLGSHGCCAGLARMCLGELVSAG